MCDISDCHPMKRLPVFQKMPFRFDLCPWALYTFDVLFDVVGHEVSEERPSTCLYGLDFCLRVLSKFCLGKNLTCSTTSLRR